MESRSPLQRRAGQSHCAEFIRLLTGLRSLKLLRSRVRGPGDHDADGELQAARTSSQVSSRNRNAD